MSGVYDHASDDDWKAKHDPDRQRSPFVNTPPTKPGWYWKQIDSYDPRPCEVGQSGRGVLFDRSTGLPLEPMEGVQWDPTPILGPGELQKVVREAYFEGWYDGRDVARNRGYDEEIEEVWEGSVARSKCHVSEPQATVTAEDRR